MDIRAARDSFPGTRGRAFLDAACVSLMPSQAAQALAKLSDDLLSCPARDASSHHIALDATADLARNEIARLIDARPAEIALVESTTHALQVVAAMVPLTRGDRVLVGETEFLGLVVPWIGRREAVGFVIDTVPHHEGRLRVEDFARMGDSRTRILLLSSVQWNNGFRADLAAFGELARERGWILVVDVIQQLGAIPIDVRATPVDFLVCGGHKWLNAPVGRGFLYVNPARQALAENCPRGYLQIAAPAEGWAEYFATPTIPAVRDYDFVEDARACELGGTANYPGNVVLAASVGLLNALGKEAIASHVLRLGAHLIERLERVGVVVISPKAEAERSGIISFTLGDGVERDRAMLARLWDAKVIVSHRYTAGVGGLRASVHVYNDEDDVGRLVEAITRVRGN